MAWQWPWQVRGGEPANTFLLDLRQVEDDCLRRLNYIDMQLNRIAQKRSHWSAAMTVADVDIMPVGRSTRVMTAMRSMQDWHWYIVIGIGALFFLTIIVGIAMCDAPGTTLPPEAP